MNYFRLIGFSLLSCCFTYGWGAMGHRIIASCAMGLLTEPAQLWVDRILDGAKLQDVSNWADEIRSDDTPWSKSIAKWHIYNFDHSSELYDLGVDAEVVAWPDNLYEALHYLKYHLGQCVATENQGVGEQKCEVLLKLLVHMVADAHQPLHVDQKMIMVA